MEPDHHETIAVVAWRCPGCASTVWEHGRLIAEPPQPPEVRQPVIDPPRRPNSGWILGVNAFLIVGCAVAAAVSEHWPIWFLVAVALLAINYAIARRGR